jgi:hypothetical protein
MSPGEHARFKASTVEVGLEGHGSLSNRLDLEKFERAGTAGDAVVRKQRARRHVFRGVLAHSDSQNPETLSVEIDVTPRPRSQSMDAITNARGIIAEVHAGFGT